MLNSDVARRWIVANVIALVVNAGLGLVGYAIRKTTGADTAAATLTAQSVTVAAETVTSVVFFALYAQLTREVLASIVPAFPRWAWLNLHMAFGFVFGVCLGLMALQPGDGDPLDPRDTQLMVGMFCLLTLGGGILGAASGGLQALVMRPVAEGLRLWIVCSAIATCVLGTMLLVTFVLLPDQNTLRSELVVDALTIVAGVVGAVIMLPAVRRLRPRSSG